MGDRTRSETETLAIPARLRAEVDERDQGHCRVCGKYLGEARALHHVKFGGSDVGMGGRRHHALDNLVSVCWMWGGNCHDRVHREKHRYQAVLLEIAAGQLQGRTALQVLRARDARSSGGQSFTLAEVGERFRQSVRPVASGCIEWIGQINEHGYGVLNYKVLLGRPVGAHRVAWFLAHGSWPAGDLLHSCDNPPCVNLEHLRVGTHAENMEDRRRRNPRYGPRNPNARYAALVPELRRRAAQGESQASLVRAFMIPSATVSRIVSGVSYPVASSEPVVDSSRTDLPDARHQLHDRG